MDDKSDYLPRPYYEDASVTIYHGDCADLLPVVAAGAAAVVTSPPYNTLGTVPTAGSGIFKTNGWIAEVNASGYADDRSEAEYVEWQCAVAAQLASACRPGASFFYNHKLRYRDARPLHPLDIVRRFPGWSLRQELVWDRRKSMVLNARMFAPCDERIFWLVRDGADFVWNQEAVGFLSVWQMSTPTDIDGHPCPYPVDLPARCLLATTAPHDLVLDPFMGSGTTLRAAKSLGRRAIGIDVEERFCEIAARRMGQEVLDLGGVA